MNRLGTSKHRRDFRSIEHDRLVRYVTSHANDIFGEDGFELQENVQLAAGENRAGNVMPVMADLIGRDSQGNIVIVEVKPRLLKEDFKHYNAEICHGVGQVLQSACAKIRQRTARFNSSPTALSDFTKQLRLFIVSPDDSQELQEICEMLRPTV